MWGQRARRNTQILEARENLWKAAGKPSDWKRSVTWRSSCPQYLCTGKWSWPRRAKRAIDNRKRFFRKERNRRFQIRLQRKTVILLLQVKPATEKSPTNILRLTSFLKIRCWCESLWSGTCVASKDFSLTSEWSYPQIAWTYRLNLLGVVYTEEVRRDVELIHSQFINKLFVTKLSLAYNFIFLILLQ